MSLNKYNIVMWSFPMLYYILICESIFWLYDRPAQILPSDLMPVYNRVLYVLISIYVTGRMLNQEL